MIEAYNARYERQCRDHAVALYNAASFLADTIGKQFAGGGSPKSFGEAFPGFAVEQKPMDDDALFRRVLTLNTQFGGSVTRVG